MFRKCINCGKHGSPVQETVYNLAGEYGLRFCVGCWHERVQYQKEQERLRAIAHEELAVKQAEAARIEELRRKVDVYELEIKARQYGISLEAE